MSSPYEAVAAYAGAACFRERRAEDLTSRHRWAALGSLSVASIRGLQVRTRTIGQAGNSTHSIDRVQSSVLQASE